MSPLADENPFVGPRALGRSDGLYGRDTDLALLRDRLISDRVVLLYSPSGAGKTSLIEAGLRAELEQYDFIVPPTVRFGGIGPAKAGEGDHYGRGVVAALTGEPDPTGATPDLEAVLSGLEEGSDSELCLIFDQFEELFTLDPGDHRGRETFVQALGDVLRDRSRWALFAIREDFIAQLDPYLEYFPTLLTSRMRLELLDPTAAEEAARGPAAASGRPFSTEALKSLVSDLRLVKRLGIEEPVPGPFVEPVQLQVVCRRVWQAAAAAGESVIESSRIDQSGGVDAALRLYYAEQIEEAAATGVSQALIRSWIDRELIDEHGFRRPTNSPPARSDQALQVITVLEDGHLIRADERLGNRWYELAHDRLVGPIGEDNSAWTRTNADDPVVRADLWADQRLPDLLLSGKALRRAEATHDEHRQELRDIDRQFLAESQRRRWRRRAGAFGVFLVAALALVAGWQAFDQARLRAEAEREQRRAQAAAVASRAASFSGFNRGLGLALAAESVQLSSPPITDAFGALLDARVEFAERLWQPSGRPLEGHTDKIVALAVSPDGATLATASRDRSVRWWSLETGEEKWAPLDWEQNGPAPPDDGLTALAWSPDGAWLVVGHEAGLLRLIDAETREFSGPVIDEHTGRISEIDFHPDDGTFATASWDGTVRIWSTSSGRPVGSVLSAHEGGVAGLAFSPDGLTLATGGGDRMARLWDVSSRDLIAELAGHEGKVAGVTWSPDGATLATFGDDDGVDVKDRTVRLWDAGTGDPIGIPLQAHFFGLTDAAFNPDGDLLATASWDGNIVVWDPSSSSAEMSIIGHNAGVADLEWFGDGNTLVSVGDDRTARRWEVGVGRPVEEVLAGHSGGVSAVGFGPDGSLLATAGRDGVTRLWDLSSRAQTAALDRHEKLPVLDVAFSPDGELLATAGQDWSTRVWEVTSGGEATEVAVVRRHSGPVRGVAFSPDGSTLATIGKGEDDLDRVWLLDVTQPSEIVDIGVLTVDRGEVSAVAFTSDGEQILTAGGDGTLRLWEVDDLTQIGPPFTGHGDRIPAVAFSPDGSRFATASRDGTVGLWDLSSPEPASRSSGAHRGGLTGIAWSPDGSMVASSGLDGTVRIWDAETGQQVSSRGLEGDGNSVNAVAWSPDGTTLATGSDKIEGTGPADETARLWNVFSVEGACRLVEQYVPAGEVRSYLPDESLRGCTGLADHP